MPDSDGPANDGPRYVWYARSVDAEKSADVLQATFEHYYGMALDHHTKATTTSNILLLVVGAIIAFIGLDEVLGGAVDLAAALAVFGIGAFGAVWAWKQNERYFYWRFIALKYQKELSGIVPRLKPESEYEGAAQDAAADDFGNYTARTIHVRHLWVTLHAIVAVIGLVLSLGLFVDLLTGVIG